MSYRYLAEEREKIADEDRREKEREKEEQELKEKELNEKKQKEKRKEILNSVPELEKLVFRIALMYNELQEMKAVKEENKQLKEEIKDYKELHKLILKFGKSKN